MKAEGKRQCSQLFFQAFDPSSLKIEEFMICPINEFKKEVKSKVRIVFQIYFHPSGVLFNVDINFLQSNQREYRKNAANDSIGVKNRTYGKS